MSLENPFDNFQAIKKYYYENIMDIGEISNNEKFLQKLDKIIQLEERLDDPQTVKLEKIEIPKNESEGKQAIKNFYRFCFHINFFSFFLCFKIFFL